MNQSNNLIAYGIYDIFCKSCKTITKGRVRRINRKRGVQLECCFCNTKKYVNVQELQQQEQNSKTKYQINI